MRSPAWLCLQIPYGHIDPRAPAKARYDRVPGKEADVGMGLEVWLSGTPGAQAGSAFKVGPGRWLGLGCISSRPPLSFSKDHRAFSFGCH